MVFCASLPSYICCPLQRSFCCLPVSLSVFIGRIRFESKTSYQKNFILLIWQSASGRHSLRHFRPEHRRPASRCSSRNIRFPCWSWWRDGAPLERGAPSGGSSAILIRGFSRWRLWRRPARKNAASLFYTAILPSFRGPSICSI